MIKKSKVASIMTMVKVQARCLSMEIDTEASASISETTWKTDWSNQQLPLQQRYQAYGNSG